MSISKSEPGAAVSVRATDQARQVGFAEDSSQQRRRRIDAQHGAVERQAKPPHVALFRIVQLNKKNRSSTTINERKNSAKPDPACFFFQTWTSLWGTYLNMGYTPHYWVFTSLWGIYLTMEHILDTFNDF